MFIGSKQYIRVPDVFNKFCTNTGLQVPQLKVQPIIVNEGDEVNATCSAPDELGGLNIYFYENKKVFHVVHSKDNSATTVVKLDKAGNTSLHCNYGLMLHPSVGHSRNSNTVNIYVQGKIS